MPAMIEVLVVPYSREAKTLRAIREDVFVREQRVPAELEHDAEDLVCTHVLAYVDGAPAGTGRLLADGKFGRMAVLAAYRGAGVGRALLDALTEVARERGLREMYCSAQQSAIGFYERAGFTAEGAPYQEAGITHRMMRRRL